MPLVKAMVELKHVPVQNMLFIRVLHHHNNMLLCSNPEQQGAESNTLVRSVGICLLFKAIFILYKLPAMKNT